MGIQQMMLTSGGDDAPLEFIGASSNGADNNDFTLAYPGGILAGDLMLIATSTREPGRDHPTAPAGWTELGGDQGFALYRRVAAGGESGTLLMTDADRESGAVLFVLRNAATTPVDFDWTFLDDAAPVPPASTATAAGQIHLIGGSGRELGTLVTPSGYSVAAALNGSDNAAAAAFWGVLAASGATPTPTLSGGANWEQNYSVWSVVVGPA